MKVDRLHRVASHDPRTPLCTAAEQGHARIVDALLKAGADRDFQTEKDGNTPLLFAVRRNREDVVKLLLEAGADISMENAMAKTPKKLAEDGDHHTILQMLAQREEDGPLAETDAGLSHQVDHKFKATVVDFIYTSKIYQHEVKEVSIDELLKNLYLEDDQRNDDISFRWLHLPANNMRWVEVLMARLFNNPTQAYRVLSSERWVGRQHRGASDNYHARFMQPMCQAFHGISKSSSNAGKSQTYDNGSRECLVLFMPYLHWDTADQQSARELVMKRNASVPEAQPLNETNETNDQSLLRAYLQDAHPLHVRRTLDQYYYHAMKDTQRRDLDQVVSRYQQARDLEPKLMTMVDQLWLWVLAGDDSRVDTVITCFPHREQSAGDPDRYDFTDVLKNIKLHLIDDTSSVRTAYDLAGLIASKCSRAYLDIGGINQTPGFSEMYETAISDVMREETELFETFNILTKAPDEENQLTRDIVDVLAVSPVIMDKLPLAPLLDICRRYRDSSFHEPLTISDINALDSLPAIDQKALAMQLIRKIGRIQVLDISKEISLLREIKDIQDELSIMSMLFDDQKKILNTLEGVIRSKDTLESNLQALQQKIEASAGEQSKEPITLSEIDMRPVNISQGSTTQAFEEVSTQAKVGHLKMDEADGESSISNERKERSSNMQPANVSSTQRPGDLEIVKVPGIINDPMDLTAKENRLKNSKRAHKQVANKHSGKWSDPTRNTPPLAVVQGSIDEISKMFQRAKKANQALDFLVDLKQKQSNVLDSRSARIQTEESLKMTEQTVKMTKENKRQGKTLMVFTIVTIIFLPLSFMAAFFAINIAAFQRDEKGFLGLGYVSEIMFPISATITAVLIYFAFKVERLENVWTWIKNLSFKAWMKIFGRRKNLAKGLPRWRR
ncbi:hypothetical protein BKA61DRAFT_557600 [Leptodontidium sp. MPI-SDFR-AT-0119]|nr:hypothetical protein BKA61DRAFT_557600 [Leptodontidium sp. MPI-SDFR-AT-0119]